MIKIFVMKIIKILGSFILSMGIMAVFPVTVAGDLTDTDIASLSMEEVVQVDASEIEI